MRSRLVIISNEMPNFRDASKAIVRRFLVLCTPRSFTDEGTASTELKEALLGHLPAILNWSIEGRAMLKQDKGFKNPPSTEDLIDEAQMLASPVALFMSEECELGPRHDATFTDMFDRWKKWAEKNGYQTGNKQLFGRNLRAASGFKIQMTRPREADSRFRLYKGIRLKTEGHF